MAKRSNGGNECGRRRANSSLNMRGAEEAWSMAWPHDLRTELELSIHRILDIETHKMFGVDGISNRAEEAQERASPKERKR